MFEKLTRTFLWISAVFCVICMGMSLFVAIYAKPDDSKDDVTQPSVFDQSLVWYVIALLFVLGALVFGLSAYKAGKKEKKDKLTSER